MSATCQSKSSPTKATNIQIRRVLLSDPSQVPSDLSSTPGGTLFSTTPGGTRIVYDRAFLLECRNSPLANSPPVGLPQIPGVTCTISPGQHVKNGVSPSPKQHGPGGGLPHGPHHGGHGHGHGPHHGHAVHVTSPLTADALPKTSPPPTGSLAPSVEEPQFDMDM